MKNFVDISSSSFSFSSCEACPSHCCDGREGTVLSEILLEDFSSISKNFPIVFTFGSLGYLKANILFSNGKDFCPYVNEYKCSIYENRPEICRLYPLSRSIEDKIYIDINCQAVNSGAGEKIVDKGKVSQAFDKDSLYEYHSKFNETFLYLSKYNDKENFERITTVSGISIYRIKEHFDDKYLKLHIKSLDNLNKVFKDKNGTKHSPKTQ